MPRPGEPSDAPINRDHQTPTHVHPPRGHAAPHGHGGRGGSGGYPRGGNSGAPGYGNLGGGGGGGAGDSYAAPSTTDVSYGTAPAGNGSITISWSLPIVLLETSTTTIAYHRKIKLTAKVEGLGTPMPTGSVAFYDTADKRTTLLGTAQLKRDGKLSEATFTTSALPPGTNRLYVTYGGDVNYPASRSEDAIVMVNDAKESATPKTVNFGETALGFTAWRQVVVSSTGLTPLQVESIQLSSGGSFDIVQTNCLSTTFAPGESCTVLFGFDPQTQGPASGTADITTSAST